FGFHVGDVLAQIPAIRMHRLGLAGAWIGCIQGFFADAGKASADILPSWRRSWTRRRRSLAREQPGIRNRRRAGQVETAVIVSPLDQHVIAGLDQRQRVCPVPLRDVAMAGKASDGTIDDVDLRWIEQIVYGMAPAPLTIGTGAVTVAHRRVTDENQRWQISVCRPGQTKINLLIESAHRRPPWTAECGCPAPRRRTSRRSRRGRLRTQRGLLTDKSHWNG